MQKLTVVQAMRMLAKAIGRPCVYIALSGCAEDELAAPYLNRESDMQLLIDCVGIVVCEDEAEMKTVYDQTVGDDGPTKLNEYSGEARVYALTCNANGDLETENT